MRVYSHILQGSESNKENAIEHAKHFDFMECEIDEQSIPYASYVDTFNGIDIYYNFGADYYFFSPTN